MPVAVLFDLDGVLIDSRTAIVRCIEHGLRANGVAVPPAAELERFIGPPLIDAFAVLLCERLGLSAYVRAIVGPALDALEEVKAVTVARALHALGLEPGADAPLVGDRSHDVEAARANAIPCVGVLWGIGDAADLHGADVLVAAPADLPAALSLN